MAVATRVTGPLPSPREPRLLNEIVCAADVTAKLWLTGVAAANCVLQEAAAKAGKLRM